MTFRTVSHSTRVPGFVLSAHQSWDDAAPPEGRRPIVILPGYGMNSFIFSYHPSGPSMEGYLASRGFEVWRADLRGQGESVSEGGSDDYSLADLADTDVGAVLDLVRARTRTGQREVTVIGCSLGGTLMFLHAALRPDHPIRAFVAMGSPVRWVAAHPLMRLAVRSPRLLGLLPVRGTRLLAERALPFLATHGPWLLSAYMNPEITDTSVARHFAKTVEDPNRHVNRELARWVKAKDLVVRGHNLTHELRRMRHPLLCVVANSDGVVPMETASFAYHASGATDRAILEVGTSAIAMGHADMFVSREAQARVFEPLSQWIAARS